MLYDNHALSIWSFVWADSSYCPQVYIKEGALIVHALWWNSAQHKSCFSGHRKEWDGLWGCINAMRKSLFSKSICLIIPVYQFLSYSVHMKWPTLTLCINVLASDWSTLTSSANCESSLMWKVVKSSCAFYCTCSFKTLFQFNLMTFQFLFW